MKIVFMGTPDFAVPSLQAIAGSDHEIAAVVTQPDRPKGRGKAPVPPAVKLASEALGLPVLQFDSVNRGDAVERLRQLAPDAIVVVAFGQILRRPLLEVPRHGCVNVHGSLLPAYRGAAPIAAAILAGEAETGVTIQCMAAAMDAGDILAQAHTPIGPDEDAGQLHDRLARLAQRPLVAALDHLSHGCAAPRPQDHARATYTSKLSKADGLIDWSRDAEHLGRFVRAMTPWPGAASTLHMAQRGKPMRVQVLQARPAVAEPAGPASPGQVLSTSDRGIRVACGRGVLDILRIQQSGKRALQAAEFLRGQPVAPGDQFGNE